MLSDEDGEPRVSAHPPVSAAQRVIDAAIEARIFPAAAVDVGSSVGPMWRYATGTLTFDTPVPASLDTIFDLASLTKPIGTTTVLMQLVLDGRVRLDEAISETFEEWRGHDREGVTVRDLLEHASGLAARLVDPSLQDRREFEHDICTMPLEYVPRSRSIYSDLGFILLGLLASTRGRASLADAIAGIVSRAGLVTGSERLAYDVRPDDRQRVAPTVPLDDDRRRGRTLVGEVHDSYAAVLGAVAGHAGLFGDAGAVGAFARTMLRAVRGETSLPPPFTPDLASTFTTRSVVPGSSRALGWDTMLPTSSCGVRMSARAFGHVGFTGTSLWIDPARDRYFVLLTNRACHGGSLDEMRTVRRAFHDALGEV